MIVSYKNNCRCSLGYTGITCDQPCPDGKYGLNCTLDCECYGGAKCDPVQGCCDCPTGRYGNRCQYSTFFFHTFISLN